MISNYLSYQKFFIIMIFFGSFKTHTMDIDLCSLWHNFSHKIWGLPNAENSAEDACSICYEDLNLRSQISICNNKHKFHKNCLFKWLENHPSCPLCRSEVDLEQLLLQKLSPGQEIALSACTFGAGMIHGIQICLSWKQFRSCSLRLYILGYISRAVIEFVDNRIFPQPRNIPPSTFAQARRSAETIALTGYIAHHYGMHNRYILNFVRPLVANGITHSGDFLVETLPLGFDYKLTSSLKRKKRNNNLRFLTFTGFITGVVVGLYIENKVRELVSHYA